MPTLPTGTRGPLAARVYWRRRFVALVLTAALVFVVARVLSGGGDPSQPAADRPVAQQAAATPSASATAEATDGKASKGKSSSPSVTPTPTPLADPTGPCLDGDLVVTPVVPEAVGDSEVAIVLQLRTNLMAACTFRVSADQLTVKISAGDEDIWSSMDCPGVVPVQDIVVRRDVTTTVGLVWRGKKSDDTCSPLTDWALPGSYDIQAAALGGEPTAGTFDLAAPEPDVIVTTPKPKGKGKRAQKSLVNQ